MTKIKTNKCHCWAFIQTNLPITWLLLHQTRTNIIEVLAKPLAWEGQRPRCPRFAAARATRTLPLPGFASVSQDYGVDEILYIARIALFNKTNQLIREITTLFMWLTSFISRYSFSGVSPQFFPG